ncbi:MAG: hypothetical protein K2V38_14860 [Gemmataceae bacterium]|nr:hypothetical protein [Gemmataceae bacterium]
MSRSAERAKEAEFVQKMTAGDAAADGGRWHQAQLLWRPLLSDRDLDATRHFELRLRLLRSAQFLNERNTVLSERDALEGHPLADRFRGWLNFERAVSEMGLAMEYATTEPDRLGADENPHEARMLDLLQQVRADP